MKIFLKAWSLSELFLFLKNAWDLLAKLLWLLNLRLQLVGQNIRIQEYLQIISMHINIRKLWQIDYLNFYRFGSSLSSNTWLRNWEWRSVQGSFEYKGKFRSEEFIPYELIEFDTPSIQLYCFFFTICLSWEVCCKSNSKPPLTSQPFPILSRQALEYLCQGLGYTVISGYIFKGFVSSKYPLYIMM